MAVNWEPDKAALAVIESLGLPEPATVTMPVTAIDKKRSLENRARVDAPVDGERSKAMEGTMVRGFPFPMIVVRRVKAGGKMCQVIAGGNHRFAAACGVGETEIPAHCVECTDGEFDMLCRLLNTVVGSGTTSAERLAFAVDAVQRLGVHRTRAAEMYGVTRSAIDVALRTEAVRHRLAASNPAVASRVCAAHLKAVHQLADNDNVLAAVANVLATGRPTVKEVTEIARNAAEFRTEAERVEYLNDVVETRKRAAGRIVPRKKRLSFLRLFGGLESLILEASSFTDLELEQSDILEVSKRCRSVIQRLQTLCKAAG